MQNSQSPLRKYKREPKLYIDLPSQGMYYPAGSLDKAEEVAVYSMTASDEISIRTPDALFSGNAVAKLIQNCIPEIKDPWNMPIIDVETCLTAIRLASYGENMNLGGKCPSCGYTSEYQIQLQSIIDHFTQQKFIDTVEQSGFRFLLRPLTYRESTSIQKASFKLQRQITQHLPKLEDEDQRERELQRIYDELANIRVDAIVRAIGKIETADGEEETDFNEIVDFVENQDKDFFNTVKNAVERNRENWSVPPAQVECESCNKEFKLGVEMDYSNFFDKP